MNKGIFPLLERHSGDSPTALQAFLSLCLQTTQHHVLDSHPSLGGTVIESLGRHTKGFLELPHETVPEVMAQVGSPQQFEATVMVTVPSWCPGRPKRGFTPLIARDRPVQEASHAYQLLATALRAKDAALADQLAQCAARFSHPEEPMETGE
jgi:hypothetical protein